jgi:hypothetical protein
MFFEPQEYRGEGVFSQATYKLSFEHYIGGLESFFKRLRGSATFPNVLLPTGCSSPLKNVVLTVQPEDVVSFYAQLFGRLPGLVVVIAKSSKDFVDLPLFEEYFEKWFSSVYRYCPKVIVLPDEELYRLLEQGQKIPFEGRFLELICYYPPNSKEFKLGDKSILRRCLESSPVEGCAELLVPGKICARGDLQKTLKKTLLKFDKLVVQAPSGTGGFGTWIIEKSNTGYTVNDKRYGSLHNIVKEILAQADSSEFIVMEFIEHTPVSMGAVLKEDGYYTLGPVRRQLVDGASYKGVYFESTQPPGFEEVRNALESFLRHHCDNLPNRQDFPPIMGFDFLSAHESQEKLFITECNPRQTGALPLEMLLALLMVDGESLYSKLTSGHLSAFELDHCKVPPKWASDLDSFEREFPKTLSARFGLNFIFLPAESRECGVEVVLKETLQTPKTILVAPATPPNDKTGKIALQFVGPPEVLREFFDELTNKGDTLEVNFENLD